MAQDAMLTATQDDPTLTSTTIAQDATLKANSTFRQCLLQDVKDYSQRLAKYEHAIKEAKDEQDIFKLLLLMDVTALGKYIEQTQVHADQSFQLSKSVAIGGSCLLLFAIALGTCSQLLPGMHSLEIAYLSAIAGLITQLISGVFFYFYHMTLRQLNDFHAELEKSRKVCVSLFAQSQICDHAHRDKAKLKLIELLAATRQLEQAGKEKQHGKAHEVELASSTSA